MTHNEFMKNHEERMEELNKAIDSLNKTMNYDCASEDEDDIETTLNEIGDELDQLLKSF